MKHLFGILMICAVLFSCGTKEEKRTTYLVNGTAPGVYNGIRVYLKSAGENGREVIRDTAIVMNEKFTFEGVALKPELWYISGNSIKGDLPFVIENEVININLDKDIVQNSVVTGTESNLIYRKYLDDSKILSDKRRTVGQELLQERRNETPDQNKIAELTDQLELIKVEAANFPYDFMKENNSSIFSLTLIQGMLKSKNHNLEQLEYAFDNLNKDIKNSAFGQRVLDDLNAKKEIAKKLEATNIGKVAPEFSAPDPEGKLIALNDIKGKVTIVDFWAAWCGPCRRENPNVVKVYEKYHDKGLEIIGVSLDGTRNQRDPKAAWMKAIADDNLTWHQVSNLKYFQDPIAQAYNIKSIPATFILDESGTIVAKNLRGAALEEKIAELLN